MDYTREVFVQLLEKHFGEVLYNGRYYLKDFDNKEVAEVLDYSEKQFGACLNPSDNTSFKTVINRLLKHDQLKELEKHQIKLKEENTRLHQEYKKVSQINTWLRAATIIGIIAIATIATWATIQIRKSYNNSTPLLTTGYVVNEVGKFDNIMNWHSHGTMNTLAWKGLVLNARVKKSETPLTPAEQQQLINDAIRDVRETMKVSRLLLYNIGFIAEDGTNIADLLEQIAPHDGLLQSKDSLFTSSFQDVIPYLLSENATTLEIANAIIRASTEVQHKEWAEIKKIMNLTTEE